MGNINEAINVVGELEAFAINVPISNGGNQEDEGSSLEETQLQKTEKDPRTIARRYHYMNFFFFFF